MILYQHLKPNDEIFYIGIGKCEKRAYNKFNRNKHWKNIVNKYGYNVEILYNNLTIKEAKQLEIYLIKYYGRKDLKTGNLVNMTSGGEGTYGRITSKESNIKRSNSMKGRIFSKEHRLKLSLTKKGRIVSEETKLKMSKSSKRSKKIINITTNEIYSSLREVCNKFNLIYSTTASQLQNIYPNTTNFKYLENEYYNK